MSYREAAAQLHATRVLTRRTAMQTWGLCSWTGRFAERLSFQRSNNWVRSGPKAYLSIMAVSFVVMQTFTRFLGLMQNC